jgi:hypothetical protein
MQVRSLPETLLAGEEKFTQNSNLGKRSNVTKYVTHLPNVFSVSRSVLCFADEIN